MIIVHEDFNETEIFNDIALLLVDPPLKFTSHLPAAVLPVCLPRDSQGVYTGEQCALAGWGVTEGKELEVQVRL